MLRSQLTSIDLGNLLVDDGTPLSIPKVSKEDRDSILLGICTENVQLLVNDLWKLKTYRAEDVQVADLPEGRTVLPREKAIPKVAPETRWESFAKLKGIVKRKKTRKVWDEESKSWVPRFGLGSKRNVETKQWLLEVPASVDPNTDMFAKLKDQKKERKAKNELNRLKNIQRSVKGKAANGVLPGSTAATSGSTGLAKALSVAQASDASMGQFSKQLNDEKKKKFSKGGQKKKFEGSASFSSAQEQKRARTVLDELRSQRPSVDKGKATRQLQVRSEAKRRKEKAEDGGGKKRKLLTDMVSKRKIKQKAGAKKFKNKVSRTGKKK